MSEITDKITALIYTLNSVEVKGKDNLDKLLGCICVLEKLQTEIKSKEEVKAAEE